MNHTYRQLITLFCTLFIFPSILVGQGLLDGYFSPRKSTDIVLSYTSKSYRIFYKGQTKTSPVPDHDSIEEQIANLYISYAASEKLSVVLNVPFIFAQSGMRISDPVHGFSEVKGLQDIGLYAKLRLLKKETNLGQILVGTAVGGAMPASRYEANSLLSIGNGATTIDALGLFRLDLPNRFFVDIQSGLSARFSNVPAAFLFSSKVGYATENFYSTIYLNQQTSLSGPDLGADENGVYPLFSETRVNYTVMGLNGYFTLTNQWGVTISTGVLIDGRNIGKHSFLTFGIGYKIQ